MDIKIISGILAVFVTVGGLFVQVGTVMNRLDVLETKSAPDISPIKTSISDMKSAIAVLETKINKLENPLSN